MYNWISWLSRIERILLLTSHTLPPPVFDHFQSGGRGWGIWSPAWLHEILHQAPPEGGGWVAIVIHILHWPVLSDPTRKILEILCRAPRHDPLCVCLSSYVWPSFPGLPHPYINILHVESAWGQELVMPGNETNYLPLFCALCTNSSLLLTYNVDANWIRIAELNKAAVNIEGYAHTTTV